MNEQNLGELLSRRAEMSPTLEAYVAPIEQQRFDYRALNSYANRLRGLMATISAGGIGLILLAIAIGKIEV
ncbi:MAG: hypothetical protein O7F73_17140 [Gammaproteobacteria bacterium]|nr:hypothetical protein [Gammaproteobacteria bacterium]